MVYALCTLTCLCSIIKQLGQKEKATLFLSNNTTTLGNHFDLLISRGSKYSFNSLETIALLRLVAKPLPMDYQKSQGMYFPNHLVFLQIRQSSLILAAQTSVIMTRVWDQFTINAYELTPDKYMTRLTNPLQFFAILLGKFFQLVSTGCCTDGILFRWVRSTSSTPPPPSGRTYIAQWKHFFQYNSFV